jgi:hypothetical protein
MTDIHIVVCTHGEYSERETWLLCAFHTLNRAQAYAERADRYARAAQEQWRYRMYECDCTAEDTAAAMAIVSRYDPHVRGDDYYEPGVDPRFASPTYSATLTSYYYDFNYSVWTVPLGMPKPHDTTL